MNGLAKVAGSQTLFTDLNFDVKRGERVASIGDNGTGKTTILKIINLGLWSRMTVRSFQVPVRIGYYDQDHPGPSYGEDVVEEISNALPECPTPRSEVR